MKIKPDYFMIFFIFLIPIVLVASAFLTERYFLAFSIAFLILSMFPIYLKFELKALVSREIVFIATLAAIAAISRVPFAPIPSVQPTTFVIMMSAIILGKESGFLIGATAALVSNMFLGQGPWTPWQMFSWGMIGYTAGILRHTFIMKHMSGRLIFGFIWGFLFGWIMNLWFLIGFVRDFSWSAILTTYLASFYFDLFHALSNVFFIYFFSQS